MPGKISADSGNSDSERIPPEQGQAEKRPADDDQDKLERAEKSLEAVNNAASTVRTLFFTFLLLGTYVGVIIGSTTDEQLLRISPVTLPILNVQLPIKAFYAIIPWLLLLVHFNCLLYLALLARTLRMFEQQAKEVPAHVSGLRERLDNFPFVQFLAGHHQHDGFMRWLLSIMVVSTIIVFPLLLLLWAQARFLPYHSPAITWIQCFAVVGDACLLAVLWPRLVSSENAWSWWRRPIRLLALPLSIAVSISIFITVLVGDSFNLNLVEKWATANKAPTWASEALHKISPLLIDAFTLDVSDEVLTKNKLSAPTVNALRGAKAKQREEALKEVLGINLQERDLRFIDLSGAILPKADLRSAQLQHADLSRAQLQYAKLSSAHLLRVKLPNAHLEHAELYTAHLQYVDLTSAQLQHADLSRAQLQHAYLNTAQLQHATLITTQLQHADLSGTELQHADLSRAQFLHAKLREAQLQGADLDFAELQGAQNLRSAKLQGADLRGAMLQGADLHLAKLQGADLRHVVASGANFEDAHFDLVDLRDLNYTPLTDALYDALKKDLESQVKNPYYLKSTLVLLKERSDETSTLRLVATAKQCLNDGSYLALDCLIENRRSAYRKALMGYLVGLACSDAAVARGLASQAIAPLADYRTKALAEPLFKARVKENCAAFRSVPWGQLKDIYLDGKRTKPQSAG